MYELSCPECNTTAQYDLRNYLLICPFCSTTYKLNRDSGKKDVFTDHYILANTLEPAQVKTLILSWLERTTYKPQRVNKNYLVTSVHGISLPYWIISLEAHSRWSGLVNRTTQGSHQMPGTTPRHIYESGEFRCDYRWGVSARRNPIEYWGLNHLHEPSELIQVRWDGFPLDSTFSRGRLDINVPTQRSN